MIRLGRVMLREERVLAVEQSAHGHVRVHFDAGPPLDIRADYLEGACPFSVWQKPATSSAGKMATTFSPAKNRKEDSIKSGSEASRVKESARK